MSMPSFTELLVILGIVALIFGTSRLRSLGGDLGAAIRGFKSALKDGSEGDPARPDAAKAETPADHERSR